MSQRVSLTIEELAWLQVALANDLIAADDLVARIVDEGRRGIDLNTAKRVWRNDWRNSPGIGR